MMNVMYQKMNHECIYVTVARTTRSFFIEMLRDKADFKLTK